MLEGWGKEAGPEESEGEDQNSLWFASAWKKWGLCLDGDGGVSPLMMALWPSSTGSAGRGGTSHFRHWFMEHLPQYSTALFLAVSVVQAVFFPHPNPIDIFG